jgi:hypothetical protein
VTTPLDVAKLTPAERIAGEDAEETALLREMLRGAKEYIEGFRWCPPVDRVYLGCGVGGVVAVFLIRFSKRIGDADEWLWVVQGDLPSAYLVLDQAHDPASAVEVYCQLMDEWVKAVLEGRSLEYVFPVNVEPTKTNATNLVKRLNFIRTRLLPEWRARWAIE